MWSLRVDHIGFADARTASDEEIVAAHDAQRMRDAVTFARSTAAVEAACSTARWWFLPAGLLRPIPYGASFTKQELRFMFGRPFRHATTDWVAALGDGDAATPRRVRYHYNADMQWGGSVNVNTMLLSSTALHLPVVAEFDV